MKNVDVDLYNSMKYEWRLSRYKLYRQQSEALQKYPKNKLD